jgi:glycopeptide antibiotics resistance protein
MWSRRQLDAALGATLGLVAAVTLLPTGRGWSWGAPLVELRWYATGLSSEATMLQLAGNLALLAPLAGLAVLRWSALARPGRLGAAALAVAGGIELLQWALPLGRVVSPLDAVLNTVGTLAAGGIVAALRQGARPSVAAR